MMSKNLLISLALLLFLVHASTAQIEKGKRFLGASVALGFTDSDFSREIPDPNVIDASEVNSFSIGLYPYMGFFVRDGLALGGELALAASHYESEVFTTDDESINANESYTGGITFFLKKMNPINDRLGWYFRPELGTQLRLSRQDASVTHYDSTEVISEISEQGLITFHLSATGGLCYFIADRWSVELDLLWLTLSHEERINSYERSLDGEVIRNPGDTRDRTLRLSSNLTNKFSVTEIFTVNYYF